MNMQPVTGPEVVLKCCKCGERHTARYQLSGYTVYADLDGAPFQAYYCRGCADHFSRAHHHHPAPGTSLYAKKG